MAPKSERFRAEENFSRAIEALRKTLPGGSMKDRKARQAHGTGDNLRPENVDDLVESLIQVRETTSKTRAKKAKEVAKLWF